MLTDGPIAADAAVLLADEVQLAKLLKLGPHPGKLPAHRERNSSWVAITLTSGRNRIVRRLCAALGHPVLRLVRVRIGAIELGELLPGESRKAQWPSAGSEE